MMDTFDREAGKQLVRHPGLRLRVRRMTTRAARPFASLALTLAVALLAVLGGLLMSSGPRTRTRPARFRPAVSPARSTTPVRASC